MMSGFYRSRLRCRILGVLWFIRGYAQYPGSEARRKKPVPIVNPSHHHVTVVTDKGNLYSWSEPHGSQEQVLGNCRSFPYTKRKSRLPTHFWNQKKQRKEKEKDRGLFRRETEQSLFLCSISTRYIENINPDHIQGPISLFHFFPCEILYLIQPHFWLILSILTSIKIEFSDQIANQNLLD